MSRPDWDALERRQFQGDWDATLDDLIAELLEAGRSETARADAAEAQSESMRNREFMALGGQRNAEGLLNEAKERISDLERQLATEPDSMTQTILDEQDAEIQRLERRLEEARGGHAKNCGCCDSDHKEGRVPGERCYALNHPYRDPRCAARGPLPSAETIADIILNEWTDGKHLGDVILSHLNPGGWKP